mmetsp:Transcript_42965/g.124903  ORF Transcript_42965/g.124903 Transcript_42965/m.124903 type:complete len:81 (-) Transcript_42965:156-398(-)
MRILGLKDFQVTLEEPTEEKCQLLYEQLIFFATILKSGCKVSLWCKDCPESLKKLYKQLSKQRIILGLQISKSTDFRQTV